MGRTPVSRLSRLQEATRAERCGCRVDCHAGPLACHSGGAGLPGRQGCVRGKTPGAHGQRGARHGGRGAPLWPDCPGGNTAPFRAALSRGGADHPKRRTWADTLRARVELREHGSGRHRALARYGSAARVGLEFLSGAGTPGAFQQEPLSCYLPMVLGLRRRHGHRFRHSSL